MGLLLVDLLVQVCTLGLWRLCSSPCQKDDNSLAVDWERVVTPPRREGAVAQPQYEAQRNGAEKAGLALEVVGIALFLQVLAALCRVTYHGKPQP